MGDAQRPEGAATEPLTIPDHRMLRQIGDGSYGEVWLAHSVLGELRAVKIVHRFAFDDDHPYEREFTGLKNFEPVSRSHEGLVDILQVGRNDTAGYFYCVMELADAAQSPQGEDGRSKIEDGGQPQINNDHSPSSIPDPRNYQPLTLDVLIRQRGGRLPVKECLAIASTLAGALQYLHDAGLVHRDIKPSNIIFVDGVPKLADVGLVARTESARTFVGTEGFLPPEGPGTPQADIYSLGKCLYEMAMGKDRQSFPSPPTLLDELPDREELLELNEVITKACEPQSSQRYSRAEELMADLRLLAAGHSLRRVRRSRHWLAVGGATFLGVMVSWLGLLLTKGVTESRVGADDSSRNRQESHTTETGDFDIIFQSDRTGKWEIYRMNPDGSQQRQLTSSPLYQNTDPFPSPDDRWVAYTQLRAGGREFRIVAPDGTEDQLVLVTRDEVATTDLKGFHPAGDRLLFNRNFSPGRSEIWTVTLQGGDRSMFLSPEICDCTCFLDFALSLDQTRAVWVAQSGNWSPRAEIYTASLGGSVVLANHVVRVTTNTVLEIGLALSPDGARLAYNRSRNAAGYGPPADLCVTRLFDPRVEVKLAQTLRESQVTAWAPAERLLLDAYAPTGVLRQLYSVRPDGSGLARLTDAPSQNTRGRWLRRTQ